MKAFYTLLLTEQFLILIPAFDIPATLELPSQDLGLHRSPFSVPLLTVKINCTSHVRQADCNCDSCEYTAEAIARGSTGR